LPWIALSDDCAFEDALFRSVTQADEIDAGWNAVRLPLDCRFPVRTADVRNFQYQVSGQGKYLQIAMIGFRNTQGNLRRLDERIWYYGNWALREILPVNFNQSYALMGHYSAIGNGR